MKRIKRLKSASVSLAVITNLYSGMASAVETIPAGTVGAISYDSTGINFKMYAQDGSIITDSGACGSNNSYHLPLSNPNYKAITGALVSAHTAKSKVQLVVDGCVSSHALLSRLSFGQDPDSVSLGNGTTISSILFQGNGIQQLVSNGIDSASGEAMVVTKSATSSDDWAIFDTLRGAQNSLSLSSANGQVQLASGLTAFRADGHAVDGSAQTNGNGKGYWHWTMKSAPGFFDVVSYTGNGSSQSIAHNLGSDVGMIWVKRVNGSAPFVMWHKDLGTGQHINMTDRLAAHTDSTTFSSAATTTSFSIGASSNVNANGEQYIAYVFAHNPNQKIASGRYVGSGGAGNKQTLGFKPSVFLLKDITGQSGTVTFFSTAMSGGDTWKDPALLSDQGSGTYFSTAINSESDGFSFSGGSGNWAGADVVYLAIGE